MGMCADIGVPRPRGHFRILRLEEHGSGCQIKLLRPLASSKSLLQLCALKLFGYFNDEQIYIACGVIQLCCGVRQEKHSNWSLYPRSFYVELCRSRLCVSLFLQGVTNCELLLLT